MEERLEEIGDVDTWSVSALKCIGQCGKQYEFRYRQVAKKAEATPPLAFGSAVHKCVERLHKEGDKWEPSQWQRMWNDEWYTYASRIDWAVMGYRKSTFDKLGVVMLDSYITNNRDADILESEWAFPNTKGESYSIDRYPIKGIIDQVRRQPNGKLLIVDLKTSKDKPDPLLLRSDPQFTFYWAAAREKYGEEPELAWLHLRTGELIKTRRTEADLEIVREMLHEGQVRVDNKMFARNIGFSCKYCPFINDCLGPLAAGD